MLILVGVLRAVILKRIECSNSRSLMLLVSFILVANVDLLVFYLTFAAIQYHI